MLDSLNPYPLIFCPDGVEKPACCAHKGSIRVLAGKGPEGLGGKVWGGGYEPANGSTWNKTPAGWYLNLRGHKPQNLTRLDTNPRIVKWITIEGALDDHFWRVPVLLTKAGPETEDDLGYLSALDRVWTGQEWSAGELADLQNYLLSVMSGIPADLELEKRNEAMRELAIRLLALGQWVDSDLLAATGWLSERVMHETIVRACGLQPKMVPDVAD